MVKSVGRNKNEINFSFIISNRGVKKEHWSSPAPVLVVCFFLTLRQVLSLGYPAGEEEPLALKLEPRISKGCSTTCVVTDVVSF